MQHSVQLRAVLLQRALLQAKMKSGITKFGPCCT